MTQIVHEQLRSIVQRIERLDEEIGTLNEDKSEVYKEAKANGYDVKALREIIRIRRKDAAEQAEHESVVDLYRQALGMVDATRARTDALAA
jgi:uncharacterized protein (UPF0335 family)